MFDLAQEDLAMFARPLAEMSASLHVDLLEQLYARYPELQARGEIPTVSSELRWQDVTLPDSVSEADLDAILFSILTSRPQKTAMVIGTAMIYCKKHALPIDAEIIGARTQALNPTISRAPTISANGATARCG